MNARFLSFSATAVLLGLSAPLHADLLLTGEYDSATTNANQVDVSATSDANPNELSLATFTTLVETAFANQTGGVVTFDNAGDSLGSIGITEDLVFADNSVLASFSRVNSQQIQSGGGGRTPISGNSGVGGATSYAFDFDEADEITAVGLTILSRSGNGSGNASVVATFLDASGGGVQTVTATSNLADSNGGDDTFFGFSAPDGLFLTRLDISTPYFTYTDDLAVVTPIPEPGALSLVGLGLLTIARCRRIR
ncbi:MAG: PEP-CTERM sorting domain-containing protein [Planctomycetota bacterium]